MSDSEVLFAVVEFDEEINKKKCVELVPISWLFGDDNWCYYPPKKDYEKVEEWVKELQIPKVHWSSYPVTIIAKASDYEQGLRRLKRSFKKKVVNSSDNECQHSELVVLDSAGVSKALLQTKPLGQARNENALETILEEASNSVAGPSEKQQISFSNEAMEDLKLFIKKEISNAKRSILYDLDQKLNNIKAEILRHSESIPSPDPWKILREHLPAVNINEFIKLDELLTNDIEKQEGLKQIFHLETVGSSNYENDIKTILRKLISKDIQLEYSACGRKVKGVGKKIFQPLSSIKL